MSIDYSSELKKIEDFTGDYWKPKAGQYRVKAVGEIEEDEPYAFEEGKEPQARVSLSIDIEGKKYLWNFPKGRTGASTYGQLVRLANSKGNKLAGAEFTVVVIGEGQSIRFTIVI